MTPSRALIIGWTEIEAGCSSETGRAAGSRCGRWDENYLAREPHWITDGSSKGRKKSARSAPRSFARRGNRIFELNAVPGGKLENGLCNLPLGLTWSPSGARAPPPGLVAARRALDDLVCRFAIVETFNDIRPPLSRAPMRVRLWLTQCRSIFYNSKYQRDAEVLSAWHIKSYFSEFSLLSAAERLWKVSRIRGIIEHTRKHCNASFRIFVRAR